MADPNSLKGSFFKDEFAAEADGLVFVKLQRKLWKFQDPPAVPHCFTNRCVRPVSGILRTLQELSVFDQGHPEDLGIDRC